MSRRAWLTVAVLLVALAAVALVTRGPASDPPPVAATPSPSTTTMSQGGATPPAPRLPAEPGAADDSTTSAGTPRTYTLPDGTRVRDHRENPSEPFAIPTTPPQRRVVPMKSSEVARVHAQLRPLTDACTAQVPAAELTPGASVLVRLLVTVDGGRLVVDEATATAKGLGERAAAVEACVRERAAALQMATEHDAMQRYPLTFPYRVRR